MAHVEFATPKDLPLLFEIEKKCFSARHRWTKPTFMKLLEKSTVIIARQWGGAIVGFLSFNKHYIETIDVHPDHQGKGIATMLMDYAERYMKENLNYFPYVYLHVYVKNTNAQRLYLKRGYQVVGMVKNYYRNGEHALKLEKKL